MNPKIIQIRNYPQYVCSVSKLGNRGWVFRGHADSVWHIESSLNRFYRTHELNIKETSRDNREWDSIRKFRGAAHQYLNHVPEENDILSWLTVMQHFGSPTRLIDFTFSPLVALFFAAEGSVQKVAFGEPPESARHPPFQVHAIHLGSVRHQTRERLKGIGIEVGEDPNAEHYCIGRGDSQKAEFAGFFEGRWQSPRQIAQQGLFMVPSKIEMDIHQFLEAAPGEPGKPDPYGNPWIIFEFKGGKEFYRNIIKALLWANVTPASLFPGIEGLAKSVSIRFHEVVKNLP